MAAAADLKASGQARIDLPYIIADAGGPKHPNNSTGKGQEIVGEVLFDPWLTSPDQNGGGPSGIVVELGGPGRFAPGDTVVYSVFYHNGTNSTITSSSSLFRLP